jgi:choline transport protein
LTSFYLHPPTELLDGIFELSSSVFKLTNPLTYSIARKRILKEPLLPSKFSLGRAGLSINIAALCFLVLVFVFPFFPAAAHPDAAGMNWNILVTGCVMGAALLYYFFRARYVYVGPVNYVKVLSH